MKKKILSLVLAVTLSITTLLSNLSLADSRELNVTRIAGSGRYETAVEASKATFKTSKYAVVASGEGFADALVGGTLATQIEAPILLVGKNSVPNAVFNEIKRLGVEKVYLLGGTNTISKSVESTLNTGITNVERLAGKDRLETAKKIGELKQEFEKMPGLIEDNPLIAMVNGNNFADALAAAPFVGSMKKTHMIPYIGQDLSKSVNEYVFGGTNSVPKTASEAYRLAGSNREETAIKIAESYDGRLNIKLDTIVLVDGYNYPDALASAPVASMNNGAILLTHPTNFSKATKDYINNNDNIKNVIIVGGENSVSANIERELRGEVTPPVVEENNFDKLDKGLQAYVATSITGDWRLEELKELPFGMAFHYHYDGNTLYTQIHGGAGLAHPIYKFTVGKDSITYLDGVVHSSWYEWSQLDIPSKTVTKENLYNEYLAHKEEYDKATANEHFGSAEYLMEDYIENHK
ncbi:cell wall-binding repeat-containing protein [Miniphocaeibacter halophilus]|uniref:Cell wall-binding repeat-containing protein n=1 Tax=Miniphocaeibacter halophilus TaxID=2931922 RepID=A0AC61MU23_9FIRM|nr:cell wall-binding repeat-containing protein [Miniphocaeibacter halophilus]QQK07728.1 cell wall-binding repeat-containing protein [Miniphocaeibacter halophilus]